MISTQGAGGKAPAIVSLRDRTTGAFVASGAAHAALLLQRGLEAVNDPEARGRLLDRVKDVAAGPLYHAAYARRRSALERRQTARFAELRAPAGLAVGLGNASVLEVGLTLLHPYGVPFIPGSALKGLARRGAAKLGNGGTTGSAISAEQASVLFGEQQSASYLVFHDAWYVPASAPEDKPLARDVITVHHPRYYASTSDRPPPTDFDDPNPVSFVRARGRYLIVLEGPTDEWSEWALALVTRALAEDGVGGKTAAGYGRLLSDVAGGPKPAAAATVVAVYVGPDQKAKPAAPDVPAAPAWQSLIDTIEAIRPNDVKNQIGDKVIRWRALVDDDARLAVARAILARIDALNDRKWSDGKPWVAEIRAYIAEHNA